MSLPVSATITNVQGPTTPTARNLLRLTVGALAVICTAYWVAVTAPVLAQPPPRGYSVGTELTQGAHYTSQQRVRSRLGCADGLTAPELDEFFRVRQGPLLGWDNPHVIELGPNRWLWLVHDTYLDHSGTATDLVDVDHQVQNAAFVQNGRCFAVQHGGTPELRKNFESGDARIAPAHFLWPLGSEVHENKLFVFWAETTTATDPQPNGHGITRYPVATWLATYDVETLKRLSFDPAPNAGIEPIYGFAVSSDDEYSYLFGNTNQLNFWRNGGYENGPHSATRMFLGRVPRGELSEDPEYWHGAGWGSDANSAVPISEKFYAENTMQPQFIDGQWLSVVKRDGFFGAEIWLEVAVDPWGPWVAHEIVEHIPRVSNVAKNSYQPIILPWSDAQAGVSVIVSENAIKWRDALATPSNYRPSVFSMRWPVDPAAHIESMIEDLATAPGDGER